MLTVGEEERHKWRPKHQMHLLQQQQIQQIKDFETNEAIFYQASEKLGKESMLGRHKRSVDFSSGKNFGNLRLSKTSSNISPLIPSSYTFRKSPDDQDGNLEMSKTSTDKMSNLLDGSKKMNDNPSPNVVPTSNSDLANELINKCHSDKSNVSLEKSFRNQNGYGSSKPHNGYIDSNSKINNPFIDNNIGLDDASKRSGSGVKTSLLARSSNSLCNTVSSHNSSETNFPIKTQKSFKNTNSTTIKSDDRKNNFVGVQDVREIGRFSPNPTPYVDCPLQFNFGSTYASSVTVFFDN